MGICYRLANTRDRVAYELGKGGWTALPLPAPESFDEWRTAIRAAFDALGFEAWSDYQERIALETFWFATVAGADCELRRDSLDYVDEGDLDVGEDIHAREWPVIGSRYIDD